MKKETVELLEKLADKLGTTSEYLWSVLVNQAYVNAIGEVIFILIATAFSYAMCKMHLHFMDRDNEYSYYEKEEVLGIPMIIGAIVMVLLIIGCICSVRSIVTGVLNPEYWALEQILETIK